MISSHGGKRLEVCAGNIVMTPTRLTAFVLFLRACSQGYSRERSAATHPPKVKAGEFVVAHTTPLLDLLGQAGQGR